MVNVKVVMGISDIMVFERTHLFIVTVPGTCCKGKGFIKPESRHNEFLNVRQRLGIC